MKQEERVAREQSRLSISLTSGCCTVGSRKSSGNLAPEVHVVHARGITNGMVFTNANKHFYQLQNDSPARGCLPPIPRSSLPLSTPPFLHLANLSRNQPLPPLFLHVDQLLITRIPRVISRTIVPSPGLRKYLTLEGWKGKKGTRSFESDRVGWRAAAVDGNGNRGTRRRWIQSWIGGAWGRNGRQGWWREVWLVGD